MELETAKGLEAIEEAGGGAAGAPGTGLDASEFGAAPLRAAREGVVWRRSEGLTDYRAAEAAQAAHADAVAAGRAAETVWLLEHPPLYTAGVSAKDSDLLEPGRFPVYTTRRGGEHTYHGPGQRVGYVMLDLAARGRDVRAYVRALEEWVIRALADFGVTGERRAGRVGIWVSRPGGREEKIAAIGVRVRRWATFHGVAVNRAPDLEHFSGIVPCGISEHGVTSLQALGVDATAHALDAALCRRFDEALAAHGLLRR